jgi:hypothetical protein
LIRYASSGYLAIDNNLAEQHMKTIATGRNYAQFPLMPSPRRSVTGIVLITTSLALLKI